MLQESTYCPTTSTTGNEMQNPIYSQATRYDDRCIVRVFIWPIDPVHTELTQLDLPKGIYINLVYHMYLMQGHIYVACSLTTLRGRCVTFLWESGNGNDNNTVIIYSKLAGTRFQWDLMRLRAALDSGIHGRSINWMWGAVFTADINVQEFQFFIYFINILSGTHCPRTAFGSGDSGKCYKFCDRRMSWSEAQAYCKKKGKGRLAVISDRGSFRTLIRRMPARWDLRILKYRIHLDLHLLCHF